MVTNNHYRWDFVGLSTDEKPTPDTSPKVVDGSTFYCSDNSKLYVFCKNNWYERRPLGSGGGSDINVVQTTGESTTDVMSQKSTTDMIYSPKTTSTYDNWGAVYIGNKNANNEVIVDPSTSDTHGTYFYALPSEPSIPQNRSVNILGSVSGGSSVAIGNGATSNRQSVAIGASATMSASDCVAIGYSAYIPSQASSSVALGVYAQPTRRGEVNIGTGISFNYGYNNTNYRVLGGVHDGQLAQDAVTVNQVNSVIDAINAALSTNISHIGA